MAKTKKQTVKKKAGSAALRPQAKTPLKAVRKAAAHEFFARPAIEISATFKDIVGLTAKVAAAVAAENVNILAGKGYSSFGPYRKAVFNLVVDDFAKAEKALGRMGADDIDEASVILVDMANKVGALEKAAKTIANAGINIHYFYATTSTGETATCVFSTANDIKAIRLLNKA